jgi:microcystin-dependent protein
MAEPFLAEIHLFSFAFTPKGYAQCSGQLLPISQNQALFSLLGTTYGGDGRTTFALPDLRGRIPVGTGSKNGVNYLLGQQSGSETVQLLTTQVPSHTHTATGIPARSASGDVASPQGAVPSGEAMNQTAIYSATASTSTLANFLPNAGSSTAHTNLSPYITTNYCIALQGLYPSRA